MEELDSKYSRREERVIVGGRYIMLSFQRRIEPWNIYEGADLTTRLPVMIHCKNGEFARYRKDLHSKLPKHAPKLLWEGTQFVDKLFYFVFVFERLGPSLKHVLVLTQYTLPQQTTLLLLYNLLGLLQKFSELRLVVRSLKPSRIYLSKEPTSTELVLGDFVHICNVGKAGGPPPSKYSSTGTHIGLNASFKDDLESVCYIVFNIFQENNMFPLVENSKRKDEEMLAWKSDIRMDRFHGIPEEVANLYLYCRSLQINQTPNYQHWRKRLRYCLSTEIIKQPYVWIVQAKLKNELEVQQDNDCDIKQDQWSSGQPIPSMNNLTVEKFHLTQLTSSCLSGKRQHERLPEIIITQTQSIRSGEISSESSEALEDCDLSPHPE